MENKTKNIITNFGQLDSSVLRKQALKIAQAGLMALNAQTALEKFLGYDSKKQKLKIKKQEFNLAKFKRIFCLSLGYGSKQVLEELKLILKDKTLLDINLSEAQEFPEMFKDDLVVCIIFDDNNEYPSPILSALKATGSNDLEIAIVSKRLEKLQGGRTAKIIYPATCLSLVFSAKNNNISAIAGGPTVKDAATNLQAQAILKKYNILEQLNINSLKLRETPKEDKYFKNIHNILIASPEGFLQAAREKAEDLGFDTKVLSDDFKALPNIIASMQKGQCLLSPRVNSAMVIDALADLKDKTVLIFFSERESFIADELTLSRSKVLGLSLQDEPDNFFENLGQKIVVETGFGLGDFLVCIKG